MPIRPELLLRNLAGIPQPPAELIQRIQDRCQLPLTLRYRSGAWGVDRLWAETDPRWERVQTGEISRDMAFDNIGELPIYCGVDEAPAYLERVLRNYPVEEYRQMAESVAKWNMLERPNEIAEELINDVRDEMGKHDEITSAIFAVTPVATVAQQQDAKGRMAKARAAKATKAAKRVKSA